MTRNPYAAPTPPPRDTPTVLTAAPAPAEPAAGVAGQGTGPAAAAVPAEPAATSATVASGPASPGSGATGSGSGQASSGTAGSAAFTLSAEGQAVAAAAAMPPSGRSVTARLVWRGVGRSLAGHALTMLVPLMAALAFGMRTGSGPSVTSDALSIFVLGGIAAQLLLFVAALVTGVRRIIRRDGGVGAGILIGWAAGVPASLVAGIVICVMLAEAGDSY